MKEKIEKFLKVLAELTKDEADLIDMVLKWDNETQAAFRFAKRIFEDDEKIIRDKEGGKGARLEREKRS
jgi:hypothetical protein